MNIGTGEHLQMDEPIVKKDKKNILALLRRNGSIKESFLDEETDYIKRARSTIKRMRRDIAKKNIERDREKAKEKIEVKTKEAQILAKAKIDDYKNKRKGVL